MGGSGGGEVEAGEVEGWVEWGGLVSAVLTFAGKRLPLGKKKKKTGIGSSLDCRWRGRRRRRDKDKLES